jgi:hypothetical protein
MSEFMRRLSEATKSSSSSSGGYDPKSDGWVLKNGSWFLSVPAGRTLGSIDIITDEDWVEPTDAASGRAFAAALGKRLDAAGVKHQKMTDPDIYVNRGDKDWRCDLTLEGPNLLEVEFKVTADRKTGGNIDFEVDTIGPDASGDLVSNDPLKLYIKREDLYFSLKEAAKVAAGHAEDVLAFRKLDPDFGKGR